MVATAWEQVPMQVILNGFRGAGIGQFAQGVVEDNVEAVEYVDDEADGIQFLDMFEIDNEWSTRGEGSGSNVIVVMLQLKYAFQEVSSESSFHMDVIDCFPITINSDKWEYCHFLGCSTIVVMLISTKMLFCQPKKIRFYSIQTSIFTGVKKGLTCWTLDVVSHPSQ